MAPVDRIFTALALMTSCTPGALPSWLRWWKRLNLVPRFARSLLILMIGRGTSTYDGFHRLGDPLHFPLKAPAHPFATHYHELTGLADVLPLVVNYNGRGRRRDEIFCTSWCRAVLIAAMVFMYPPGRAAGHYSPG